LHLYHIQFGETLRQIEEREFYDAIWEISTELLNDSVEDYNLASGDLKEASKRNVAYYVDLIVVAYKVPDSGILIGAGPVMSYYEFKQPMQDRLTDEEWRDTLGSNPPERPEWTSNFANCS